MEQMQDSGGTEYLWCVNGVDAPKRLDAALAVTAWTGVVAVPTTAHILRVWKNRMIWVEKGNLRIHFSAIGDPLLYDANHFIIVKSSDEDVEPITWLEVLGDNLLVFKKNSVWSVYAEPPNPALKRIGTPGCEDRFQTCVVGDRVYFWSRNGVWSCDGTAAPDYETQNIENYLREHHNFAQASKVRMCSSRDRRVFLALATGSNTENNMLLELATDIAEEQGGQAPWLKHNLPVASMCIFRPVETDELMGGASNANAIHILFKGPNDDGVPIMSFWWSSWKALLGEEPIERLRRLNLQMEGLATVSVYKDFSDSPSFVAQITTPNPIDYAWDGGPWEPGPWEEAPRIGFNRVRPESLARYHSFKVSNNDMALPMNVFTVEMIVRGNGELHT
jgi:hypothetical protein